MKLYQAFYLCLFLFLTLQTLNVFANDISNSKSSLIKQVLINYQQDIKIHKTGGKRSAKLFLQAWNWVNKREIQ